MLKSSADGWNVGPASRALATMVEYVNGSWDARTADLLEILKTNCWHSKASFIFVSSRSLFESDVSRSSLSSLFDIPSVIWSPTCQRSNGFFGCQDDYEDGGTIKSHVTWFRFIVKEIFPVESSSSYVWHEVTFQTKWTPQSNVAICFDVPERTQRSIVASLSSHPQAWDQGNAYAPHAVILEEIVLLFDASVWAIRDEVRRIEKSRDELSRSETDYPALHDVARHATHSTETLGVAMHTVKSMIQQCGSLTEHMKQAGETFRATSRTRQHMQFQHNMLTSLRARSEANESRLRNEINLAFNIVAQNQNRTTLLISKATQSDGAAMKTVALVTLTFLPATFVSALFSMSFFDFSPGGDGKAESFAVSRQIWVYWVVVVPLTVLTMGTWFFWQYVRYRETR